MTKYNKFTTFAELKAEYPDYLNDIDDYGAWNYPLDNLIIGADGCVGMFSDCHKLKSFNVNLPNLSDGSCMFMQCINLSSFKGNLPNLSQGVNMFLYCPLDKSSIDSIVDSIPHATPSIGGVNPTLDINGDYSQSHINTITSKGWDCYPC